MADTKISGLPAVATPASTDEFAVNQSGTTKKETRAQIHTLESGETLDTTAGTAALGTTTIVTSSGISLDLVGLVNSGSQVRLRSTTDDATSEEGKIGVGHYTNAEEDLIVMYAIAGQNSTLIAYGGGTSTHNAATKHQFYTAADTTTTSGTLAADLTGVGTASILRLRGDITIDEDLNHDGSNVGFYGTAPIAKQTGVAQTAAALQTALVNLGLITAA